MVHSNERSCPNCGGFLKYYDTAHRIVRTKNHDSKLIDMRRLRCSNCGALHREIPDYIFPYKQYEADMIIGVLENIITSDTLGYEDYPCGMTMIRWRATKMNILLWNRNQ